MKAVVYMMTRNFYEKAVPSIKSMLLCGGVDKIYALIEDDAYPFDLPVEAINISEQTYFSRNGPNYSGTEFPCDYKWHQKMMQKAGRLVDWDMPIYYYNYLRPGSASWKQKKGETVHQ